jgi:hypothetical protein
MMKKAHVKIFVSGNGTTCPRGTRGYSKTSWEIELDDLHTRGFKLIDGFHCPVDSSRGWLPYYRHWVRWAKSLGI